MVNDFMQKTLYYGSGTVKGYHSRENFCLAVDPSCAWTGQFDNECRPLCVEQISSVMVVDQEGLSGLAADGIIGLGPVVGEDEGWANPELFIDVAFEQNKIDEKIFSLLIGAGQKEQILTLGGYDLERYAKSDLVWHDSYSSEYWSVKLNGFKFGESDIEVSHEEVIVDSGTSYLIMPPTNFMQVYDLLR